MTNLDWDKFSPLFGTWASKIKPFFDRGGFDPIYTFLKKESLRGKLLTPLSNLVFRCFQETDIDNTHVALLSMCPYHTYYNGSPVADGLAFSCGITNKLQPSLEKVYEGWENELYEGMNLDYYKSPDLTYLAKSGVLLWNCSLTCEKDKAGSHIEIWSEFTKFILEEALAYTGIPIVFIGKDAQKFNKYVTPLTHGQIFNIEHPSFAARSQSIWSTNGVFTKINKIVKDNNHVTIPWLASKEDIELITADLPF
jgi:uracil-DNA glycosylase